LRVPGSLGPTVQVSRPGSYGRPEGRVAETAGLSLDEPPGHMAASAIGSSKAATGVGDPRSGKADVRASRGRPSSAAGSTRIRQASNTRSNACGRQQIAPRASTRRVAVRSCSGSLVLAKPGRRPIAQSAQCTCFRGADERPGSSAKEGPPADANGLPSVGKRGVRNADSRSRRSDRGPRAESRFPACASRDPANGGPHGRSLSWTSGRLSAATGGF
jgi:hypothetical protein